MRTDMAVGAQKFVMENRIGPVTPESGKVLFQWLRDLLLFHPNPYGFYCTDSAYCYIPRGVLTCGAVAKSAVRIKAIVPGADQLRHRG